MGFAQTPNTESGPFERKNEPSIEEQEEVSGSIGGQTERRIDDLQKRLNTLPDAQSGGMGPQMTEPLSIESPSGREVASIKAARIRARNQYLHELGTLQEENRDGTTRLIEQIQEQAAVNTAKGAKKRINNEGLSKAAGVNNQDSKQEAENKVQRLQEALVPVIQELGLDEAKDPLSQLFDYFNSSEENERNVRNALVKHMPADKADALIQRLKSTEVKQAREEVAAAEMQLAVFREDRAIFNQMMEAEDPDDFIEKNKDKVKAFRDYVDQYEQREQLWQQAQERRELERAESALKEAAPRALSAATTVLLLEFGVNSDVLSQLPPEGVSAVESVVGRGGGKMVGALLANGVSLDSEAFTGQVSGQFVSLDFAEGDLFLTGENAADRGNQSEYRIDPPTPAGFEKVLSHSIGEQNRMQFIANHGAQARAMYEEFAGSTEDEALPRQEGIDGFRNFLVLLIGEGGPGEAEEEERLRDLGILDAHGTVNRSRMQLFRQALEKYVPNGLVMHEGESPVTGSPESPGFAFEDAMTLAALWDGDVRRMPDDINELKKLTKIRLTGGDIYSAQHV